MLAKRLAAWWDESGYVVSILYLRCIAAVYVETDGDVSVTTVSILYLRCAAKPPPKIIMSANNVSILYLRCRIRETIHSLAAASVSILYLRCPACTQAAGRRQGRTARFNSLFEMPHSSAAASRCLPVVSILYLRCLAGQVLGQPVRHQDVSILYLRCRDVAEWLRKIPSIVSILYLRCRNLTSNICTDVPSLYVFQFSI